MKSQTLRWMTEPALLLVFASQAAYAVSPGADGGSNISSSVDPSSPQPSAAIRPTCSNRTLSGTYTYQLEGTRDDGRTLTREAGMEVYDGRGHMSVIATFNSVPGGVSSFQTTRLSYVVYSNCTGVLSGSRGPYADIFVAPDGSSFTFVSNVAGQQISGIEHRVSERRVKIDQ
jgi:hypothetical protein